MGAAMISPLNPVYVYIQNLMLRLFLGKRGIPRLPKGERGNKTGMLDAYYH